MESFWYMFWKFSASDKIYHLHPAHDTVRKRDMESVYPQRPLSQEVYNNSSEYYKRQIKKTICTTVRTWAF